MKSRTDKLEVLYNSTPTTMQSKYTVVSDQINGKTFALAEIQEGYEPNYSLAHAPTTSYMTFEQLKHFLLGMQEYIKLKNLNKI